MFVVRVFMSVTGSDVPMCGHVLIQLIAPID
jgi:hypothetical protein